MTCPETVSTNEEFTLLIRSNIDDPLLVRWQSDDGAEALFVEQAPDAGDFLHFPETDGQHLVEVRAFGEGTLTVSAEEVLVGPVLCLPLPGFELRSASCSVRVTPVDYER